VKWNPAKVIEQICRETARAASQAIRSASPAVPHRGSSAGTTGGSLSSAVLSRAFVQAKEWGAVIRWSTLGQTGLFFHDGTPRQKARPFVLAPEPAAVKQRLQADAEKHWAKRAERVGQ
jgi:hypothetical protein